RTRIGRIFRGLFSFLRVIRGLFPATPPRGFVVREDRIAGRSVPRRSAPAVPCRDSVPPGEPVHGGDRPATGNGGRDNFPTADAPARPPEHGPGLRASGHSHRLVRRSA